jgi:hypothetical protein
VHQVVTLAASPSPRGRSMIHIAVEASGISLEDRPVSQRCPPPRRGRVGVGVKTGAAFPTPVFSPAGAAGKGRHNLPLSAPGGGGF